jgi:hypothetical protein
MVLPLYPIASKSGFHKSFHSSMNAYLSLLAFDIVDCLHRYELNAIAAKLALDQADNGAAQLLILRV